MQMYYADALEDMLNSFVSIFDIEARFVFDGDFEAIPDDDLVIVPLLFGDASATAFMEHIAQNYDIPHFNPMTANNIFIFSLLHEIGHCMTEALIESDYDDDEIEIIEAERAMINEAIADVAINSEEWHTLYDRYFCLPDEHLATDWAVEYYTKHRAECDKFAEQYHEAMRVFIERNGLEGVEESC